METYISTDVETDGPIPGPNSMLSIGSVALNRSGEELGRFYKKCKSLEGAIPNSATMKWWLLPKNQEAWIEVNKDQEDPAEVMIEYLQWVNQFENPVFVAYPAGFDFMFVYWYLMKFTNQSPFSFSAIDMKTLAMARLGTGYRKSTKRYMPKEWFTVSQRHNHIAIDDAAEQGQLFIKMLNYNQ